ncbi:MAG: hypothetical protein NTW41_12340 [Verrucomicrobia bacterium]|nr:hypothetical protein [Verrucomicrobiota bacterium]
MKTDVFGNPIRDQELLRRIEKAKLTQRARNPHAELHDPIEDIPRIRPIVREVERRAERESMVAGMGRCHDVWSRMEHILKSEHGIVWYPPNQMNTDLIYD